MSILPHINLTGEVVGRLTVLREAPTITVAYPNGAKVNRRMWECLCACGNTHTTSQQSLRNKACRSCGCLQPETIGNRCRKHGMYLSREYTIWEGIIQRCLNPTYHSYSEYGGKGINVCDEWRDFQVFHADMGDSPTPKHSIDRINGTKGYSPDNCRWATPREQCNNRRNTVFVEYKGQRLAMSDFSRLVGVNRSLLRKRILVNGMSPEQAAAMPVVRRQRR